MKILLFGADGRLGTAMKTAWEGEYELVCPSRDELEWTTVGFAQMIDRTKPDIVVNATGYTSVPLAEGEGKTLAYWLNGDVPKFMAQACAQSGVLFLHVSTDYVFDGEKKDGYVESDATHPVNAYGDSKLVGEREARTAHPTGTYIVRTSRLYGDKASSPDSKKSFVEIMIDELQQKPSIEVDDLDYSSPTLVSDLVNHITKYILEDRVEPGIYHIVNSGACTWLGWATEIREALGLSTPITARDQTGIVRPIKRPPYTMLLSTKIPSMRLWQEALRDFLSHYER